MARTRSTSRRLAAAAVLAALSFGFAGAPAAAAQDGPQIAGAANGKVAAADSGGMITIQNIAWK